ncbi:MAG: hypothetical protein VCB26_12985 [Candidatus Hydrogenedentota bacterium]
MTTSSNTIHRVPTLAALLTAILLATTNASAHDITPNKLAFQEIGEVLTITVADFGTCQAVVSATSSNPSVATVTPGTETGVSVIFAVTATGIGSARIFVQADGTGEDNAGNPCDDVFGAVMNVTVGPFSLVVAVTNSDYSVPIPTAQVFVERQPANVGFRGTFTGISGGSAVFRTAPADVTHYYVRATAGGYLPSEWIGVDSNDTGDPVVTISLIPDSNLDFPNTLRLKIYIPDSSMTTSGAYMMTNLAQIAQNSYILDNYPFFGLGELIFLGVPPGTIDYGVPNTDQYTFTSGSITLGTGVDETVTITATPVPQQFSFAPRDELPGYIVGTVANSAADPDELLENATIISMQDGLNISTVSASGSSGVYFLPDIIPGSGTIIALSEDATIEGTSKPVTVVAGEIFGDDVPVQEDTDLTVPLSSGDTDFDGLPDAFEILYFGTDDDEQGANDDPDGDGLNNMEEYLIGTDPTLEDTDGDGYNDAVENLLGSDPTLDSSVPGGLSDVWLDFGMSAATVQAGTLLYPAGSISVALILVDSAGTINVKGDVTTTTGTVPGNTLDSAVTLDATGGTVTLDIP